MNIKFLVLQLAGLGAVASAQSLPPFVDDEIGALIAGVQVLDQALGKYETPIAIRATHYFGSMFWNCVAIYSDAFGDALTGDKPKKVQIQDTGKHKTQNRLQCIAHATAAFSKVVLPDAVDPYSGLMSSAFGISPVSEISASVANCEGDDYVCMQAALDANDTPLVAGHIVAHEALKIAANDGWNQFGTDDGCKVNCRPFSDTTGYKYKPSYFIESYQPLLEDNGKGFFSSTVHVTPHIGKKAKFRFLDESERKNRVAPECPYSKLRIPEALAVIKLMREKLADDHAKMEVEFFDDKLLVGNVVIAAFVGKSAFELTETILHSETATNKLSFERLVHFVAGYVIAEHENVILAWKEKVKFDMIRPTTVIKRWGAKMINTWAPNFSGEFRAKDFEAYKRVMPHSSYVSGSSCLCQGVQDYVEAYNANVGFSTDMPIRAFPYPPGSSKTEPGVTPKQTTILEYANIAEMAYVCGESRMWGGMHFGVVNTPDGPGGEVPAGKKLCAGVGTQAADYMMSLL